MYAAVVCPRCRKGFAVDMEHRTSSCPHCGRQVRTGRMRARFTSPSAVLTAQAVAEKLLLIARSRQVICVTHLPQIASMAHRHLYIEKTTDGARTRVNVRPLEMQGRVDELARMLGGAEVTETTRRHAQEMLALAETVRLRKVGKKL